MSDNISNPRESMPNLREYIPKLSDYTVSENVGFLPENPLVDLPEYYRPWQEIAKRIEASITERTVRSQVEQMPFLEEFDSRWSEDPDISHKERCLAYVFLTFIGSAYIWQEGESDLKKIIPRQLAIPWHTISKTLGFKPVPCMASVALNNYQVRDKNKPISLENLEVICTVPCARWFFLVTVQVEVDAVSGIKAILKGKQAILDGKEDALREALQGIKESIEKIRKTSQRMGDNLTGGDFYNKVRPFLGGYGEGSKIPEGVIFEGVSEKPYEAIGGSAAQSSTIQCFDAALGIKHDEKPQEYLNKVRDYMPQKHREFILALWKGPSIKDYVAKSQNEELKKSYKNAVEALVDFRKLHYGLVTSYILKPAKAAGDGKVRGTGGTSLSDGAGEENGTGGADLSGTGGEKGTGGTDLENFLTSIEDTTEAAKSSV